MVAPTTTLASIILALATAASAKKPCAQLKYVFEGEGVGSMTADCQVGCQDAMKAGIDSFRDICQSNDGWEKAAVMESSFVRQCKENSSDCDPTFPSICKCKVATTMWRAYRKDQQDDGDAWWSCEPEKIGNRLALLTPGFLLGRGLGFEEEASHNRDVSCS